jgi:hypothetical protein
MPVNHDMEVFSQGISFGDYYHIYDEQLNTVEKASDFYVHLSRKRWFSNKLKIDFLNAVRVKYKITLDKNWLDTKATVPGEP